MARSGAGPLRVFVSHTAELASYPSGQSFVDAACAGIRRVDGVPVTMVDFGARQDVPLEVCRSEVLSCDVHLSLIGFRYGSSVPERTDGISYTEFEFEVATTARIPRLAFLIDERTPLPPALVDHDRSRINNFRRRLQEGTGHLAAVLVADPGRLEAAVSQALVRLGRAAARAGPGARPAVERWSGRPELAPSDEDLDLDTLILLLARHFRMETAMIDRQHAADILRALTGTAYSTAPAIEQALTRTARRRQRYFALGHGLPGATEELAVALAILEPRCRTADWAWGWDSPALERLEALAGETD